MLVKESISFERGKDPKKVLGIGIVSIDIDYYYSGPESMDDEMYEDDLIMMEEAIKDLDKNAEINIERFDDEEDSNSFGSGFIEIKTHHPISKELIIQHFDEYTYDEYKLTDSYVFE
jgi:hypothetical protein